MTTGRINQIVHTNPTPELLGCYAFGLYCRYSNNPLAITNVAYIKHNWYAARIVLVRATLLIKATRTISTENSRTKGALPCTALLHFANRIDTACVRFKQTHQANRTSQSA